MNSKGLAQLAYEKGMYVLTAAQGFQAAHEASILGHGLLTFALVEEGLKKPVADADPRDHQIDVREWLDYATRRVPQMQLHQMQLAGARGANLAFSDDELKISLAERTSQRPRVYYRRDSDAAPLVMAKALETQAAGEFPPIQDEIGATHSTQSLRADATPEEEVGKRGLLGVFRKGPAEDLKAVIVEEANAVYHTPNSTQAIIGTYGKAIAGNRMMGRLPKFEQRGVVQQLDSVRRFETIHRRGQGSGKDFLSLFGGRQAWQVLDLGAKISGGQEREMSFEIVGTRLEQSDLISALNADSEALNYFDYLRQKNERPCVVLENLTLTNYSASQTTNVGLGVNAESIVSSDSVQAEMQNERSSSTQLAAPVIRCYQMYEVQVNQNRVVELTAVDP
jgi:hypothetical protein